MKKEKKKKKKENKKAEKEDSKEAEKQETKKFNLNDIIFKQPLENEPIKINDLFKDKSAAFSLVHIPEPCFLGLRPSDLSKLLIEIAKFRYGFDLNADFAQIQCLSNELDKISFVRDLCKAVGISLLIKEFVLENDPIKLKSLLQANARK